MMNDIPRRFSYFNTFLTIGMALALLTGSGSRMAIAGEKGKTAEKAAETALKQGDQAIDGELVDSNGDKVQLSKLWEQGPLVVVWYRGGWCPLCQRHLSAIQQVLPEIKAAGGRVVAISPEVPKKSEATAKQNQLDYQVLSDQGNQLGHKYGVTFTLPTETATKYQEMFDLAAYNGDDSMQLPVPAAYVISPQGEITYAFVNADYRERAKPDDLLQAIKAAQAE